MLYSFISAEVNTVKSPVVGGKGDICHILLGRDINFAADSPGFINKFWLPFFLIEMKPTQHVFFLLSVPFKIHLDEF